MARLVGSDGARTEAAIRRAAVDLIAAKGFEAVSLREIAKAVGIQASSLYRYFPSKHELLTAIITQHLEHLLAQWEAVKPKGVDALERLHAFIEFHVDYHSVKHKEVFVSNMEMRSLTVDDRQVVVALRNRYESILQEILRGGIDDGLFSIPDIRVATFAILAMLTGLTAWYQQGGRLTKSDLVACYSKLIATGVTLPGDPGQRKISLRSRSA